MFRWCGIFRFLFATMLLQASVAIAILPENIGSTQYGTGYISAADKFIIKIDALAEALGWSPALKTKLYTQLDKILLSSSGEEEAILRASKLSKTERKIFLEMICTLQATDRYKKPRLFMIGQSRAVATDGHHRLRAMVKLSRALKEADLLWPGEVKAVLAPLGRVDKTGQIIPSLDLIKLTIVKKLPADVRATALIRELLSERLGLWIDPKDNALAAKFFGKKSAKASKAELRYLASKLGIVDGAKGIEFIPITELPDNSMRTLMGAYFSTRDIKTGKVAFKDYVEFYLGDDVKKIVAKDPARYPHLTVVIDPKTTIESQRASLPGALEELDELFSLKKKLTKNALDLSVKGKSKDIVKARLEELKLRYCSLHEIPLKECASYIKSVRGMNKRVSGSTGNCPEKSIGYFLKFLAGGR